MYCVFKPLNENDLPLLYRWFQEPIVNQWYARRKHWSLDEITEKYQPRISGKQNIPSFIVYRDEVPVGFIQHYRFESGFPEGIKGLHNLLFKQYYQNDLVGIDLFIADPNMRGKGFGVQLIQQFTEAFLREFSAIVVDPEINNINALRCYEKAGFKQTAFSEDKNHMIMIKTICMKKS